MWAHECVFGLPSTTHSHNWSRVRGRDRGSGEAVVDVDQVEGPVTAHRHSVFRTWYTVRQDIFLRQYSL